MSKKSNQDKKHPNSEWLTNRKRAGSARNRKTSPAEVPMLIYGDDNNFPVFHQMLAMVALEKCGNSARFITTGKAFEPDEIDPEDYDLEDDP